MVKKAQKQWESGNDVENSDSKLNPAKSVGKSLLARMRKFKEGRKRIK